MERSVLFIVFFYFFLFFLLFNKQCIEKRYIQDLLLFLTALGYVFLRGVGLEHLGPWGWVGRIAAKRLLFREKRHLKGR
jgi:hypothetical protein